MVNAHFRVNLTIGQACADIGLTIKRVKLGETHSTTCQVSAVDVKLMGELIRRSDPIPPANGQIPQYHLSKP